MFGAGDAKHAVVSTAIARTRTATLRQRLWFTGPARPDRKGAQHIRRVILPLVESIARALSGVGSQRNARSHLGFELSLVNFSAAAAADLGFVVSGYSADTALFLAMLSAALQIPMPQDTVTTGHVASVTGDIRAVGSLPVKLRAAAQDRAIQTFIYPHVDADSSLEALSPHERDRIAASVADAKDTLRPKSVSDVASLLRFAVPEESVLLGSLRAGFFEGTKPGTSTDAPFAAALQYLAKDNETRFWRVLENHLLARRASQAQELMLYRAHHDIDRGKYPAGAGLKLMRLVQSLPPTTRRARGVFPLLPRDVCMRLCQAAQETDYEDVQRLLASAAGSISAGTRSPVSPSHSAFVGGNGASLVLDAVLAEIDEHVLAQKIGLPIDEARARYVMTDVLMDSNDEFHDAVAAFYLTLLRHHGQFSEMVDPRDVADEAYALLERAFSGKGGAAAANAEARDGVNGGMRLVLDTITEQYKFEQKTKHVTRVLQEAMDPLDWNRKVAFVRALLEKLGPNLPADLRNAPPERFARHYGEITKAYVRSLDQVKQVLRRL